MLNKNLNSTLYKIVHLIPLLTRVVTISNLWGSVTGAGDEILYSHQISARLEYKKMGKSSDSGCQIDINNTR